MTYFIIIICVLFIIYGFSLGRAAAVGDKKRDAAFKRWLKDNKK